MHICFTKDETVLSWWSFTLITVSGSYKIITYKKIQFLIVRLYGLWLFWVTFKQPLLLNNHFTIIFFPVISLSSDLLHGRGHLSQATTFLYLIRDYSQEGQLYYPTSHSCVGDHILQGKNCNSKIHEGVCHLCFCFTPKIYVMVIYSN